VFWNTHAAVDFEQVFDDAVAVLDAGERCDGVDPDDVVGVRGDIAIVLVDAVVGRVRQVGRVDACIGPGITTVAGGVWDVWDVSVRVQVQRHTPLEIATTHDSERTQHCEKRCEDPPDNRAAISWSSHVP